MALAAALIQHLQETLTRKGGEDVTIRRAIRVTGGHSNLAYRLTTDRGKLFLKINHARDLPDLYASEVKGLQLLTNSRTVCVPTVITHGRWEDLTYLVMEWVEPGREDALLMEKLGRQLAALHRHSALLFGLDTDSDSPWFKRTNTFHNDWSGFFIEERLRPMVALAMEKGNLTGEDRDRFDKLYVRLPGLFPEEPPALVHGDLWKGNVVMGADGKARLVDPSVCYAHREVDLAMTRFFGQFDDAFYTAYGEVYPLQAGWEDRIDLWNLYPLLVLTVLGPDYRQRLRDALTQYL